MTAAVLASLAGYGTFLVFTAVTCRWNGLRLGPRHEVGRRALRTPLVQVLPLAAAAALFGLLAFTLFGGGVAPVCAAVCGTAAPVAARRADERRRRHAAAESWPRLVEEIRVQATSVGRSIPQALFEAGRSAPADMCAAFARAERQWLVTTDFERTVTTLKRDLADAGADAALEVLLVAHEVGGTDVERRLRALAADRARDLHDREEAKAKQAGVRFARSFVLVVPIGMALAGLSIGSGRRAYSTALGQLAVAVGIAVVAACWLWAGQLMRIPDAPRVFEERT